MGVNNGRKAILILFISIVTTMRNRSHVDGCSGMTAKMRSLRKETVFQYDTLKYPFLECARDILEIEAGPLPDLDSVHLSEMGKDRHIDGSGNALNKLQAIWNSNRCRIDNDFYQDKGEVAPNYEKLDEIYHNFLKEVIGPQMGGGIIQYQRAPTLRVYTPSTTAMGKMHNDCNYNHQPSEINFWLPLTNVFGSNTMWVESEENKGDFHPLTMKYGEYCSFYGNKCRHFTIPNDSSKTRVSLDFRAVSEASGGHDPSFRKGVRRGVKARFQTVFDVGGFYVECDSLRPDPGSLIPDPGSLIPCDVGTERDDSRIGGEINVEINGVDCQMGELEGERGGGRGLEGGLEGVERGVDGGEGGGDEGKAIQRATRTRTTARTQRRTAIIPTAIIPVAIMPVATSEI